MKYNTVFTSALEVDETFF